MICIDCNIEVKNAHPNRRRCKKCALKIKKRPNHNLTPEQIERVLPLIGEMPQDEISKTVGISRTSLIRFASKQKLSLNFHNKYIKDPLFVKEVTEYYAANGKILTLKQFPGIKIRSIIERYCSIKRQIRWKEDEIIQLAKFAGIISLKNQAEYFDRPNAHEGSIRASWTKKFKSSPSNINGISLYAVKSIVKKTPRLIKSQIMSGKYYRKLVLWVELEKCLNEDTPEELVSAIKTMAKFQRWLYGSRNVEFKIKKMLKDI